MSSPLYSLKVDLPDPFGPIIAWTSPGLISKLIPFKMGVSSTFACKFVIFNINTMLIINKNKRYFNTKNKK